MLKSNINIVYKLTQQCNTDTIDKQTMKTYFLSKINIYYINYYLEFYLIYILKYVIFMLLIHLFINCVILVLKNVEYNLT